MADKVRRTKLKLKQLEKNADKFRDKLPDLVNKNSMKIATRAKKVAATARGIDESAKRKIETIESNMQEELTKSVDQNQGYFKKMEKKYKKKFLEKMGGIEMNLAELDSSGNSKIKE